MTDAVVEIDVARDFTPTPGGRYIREGEWSGELFRQKLVDPVISRGDNVLIDLDGPRGFMSSFLEEVFGGLARDLGHDVFHRVTIRAVRRPGRAVKATMLINRALAAKK